MIPHTVVLEPALKIFKIYNGYWLGKAFDRGITPGPVRDHAQDTAGLGHHNT